MADFVFNLSKGRVAEFFNRVDSNDPANSAIIVSVLLERLPPTMATSRARVLWTRAAMGLARV